MEDITISLSTILYICGAIATIGAAVAIITKSLKKAIINTTQTVIQTEVAKVEAKLMSEIELLRTDITQFKATQDANMADVKTALLNSVRDKLNQAHTFYKDNEFIGEHSMFVLEELYKSYKALGGNSFVDDQMKDLRKLEIISAESKFLPDGE